MRERPNRARKTGSTKDAVSDIRGDAPFDVLKMVLILCCSDDVYFNGDKGWIDIMMNYENGTTRPNFHDCGGFLVQYWSTTANCWYVPVVSTLYHTLSPCLYQVLCYEDHTVSCGSRMNRGGSRRNRGLLRVQSR
jgi:hypothetical protein